MQGSWHTSTRDKMGFTLVELLVVMGIIAIVVAMLLPALKKAREQANRVACMSNLRQVGITLQMYDQDYRELPPGAWNTFISFIYSTNNILMDRYKLPPSVVACPSGSYRPNNTLVAGHISYFYMAGRDNHPNYSEGWITSWFRHRSSGYLPTRSLRTPRRKPTSDCFIMMDYSRPKNAGTHSRFPYRSNHPGINGNPAGHNVLFADLHVEWQVLTSGVAWEVARTNENRVYWNPSLTRPTSPTLLFMP